MSVSRGYGLNGKSIYMNVTKPMETWLQFTVNATDTGGLGVTSVKSNGYVEAVFMNTSATPGVSNGFTNPDPADGMCSIIFSNNFNTFLGFSWSVEPPAGAAGASVTAGVSYSIAALGTATLAQWQAKGLPLGWTPTVGQVFVATATGTIGGSATAAVVGVNTIVSATVVGDPNQMLSNSNLPSYGGARLLLQFSAATAAGTTTLIPAAPANGSIVRLRFAYDGSSVVASSSGGL